MVNSAIQANDTQKSIEDIALRYLARREYSRRELYQRLISKGFHSSAIDSVLVKLQEKGYQSDERFAEVYMRSRISAGDGPFKIKISLRAKGICDSLILALFDKAEVEWIERARYLQQKRFRADAEKSIDELAKQVRYLKNRGFYQEHIDAVIPR